MAQPQVFIIYSFPRNGSGIDNIETVYTSRKAMLSALENLKKNFPHYEWNYTVRNLNGAVNSTMENNCYIFSKTENI